MSYHPGRSTASSGLRPAQSRAFFTRLLLVAAAGSLAASSAHAVVVRGHLTDALGKPVSHGQVKLFQNGKIATFGFSDSEGNFELRTASSGRFSLLGVGAGYLPSIGPDFYGGTLEVVQRDVILSTSSVRQEVSVTATGLATPLPQLTAPVTVVDAQDLSQRIGISEELRQQPGATIVQTGQGISATSLFLRGGPSDGNKVLIDGLSANDVGGSFDFGTVGSTAISSFETYRGPDSVLYGTDAESSVISINTPRGRTLFPLLTYSGDAGSLHQVRNEVTAGGAWNKLDYYGAFSRYNTSNALSNDASHLITSAGNIGYELFPRLMLRAIVRDSVAAQGLPGAYDFYGLTSIGKEKDHDLYAQGVVEYTTLNDWHNLARYGVGRKELGNQYYGNVGTLISVYGYPEYFGNVVTIRGANGYSATGQASIFNTDGTYTSNRDELYYQSDKRFGAHLSGLFGFRYIDERGGRTIPSYGYNDKVDRTNFEYTFQLQGDWAKHLFYSAGGAIQKNHLYGLAGTPRIGLAYLPGMGIFRGTKLRANYAQGVSEPALSDEFLSLYRQLTPAQIAQYGITPLTAKRSRTYDIGIDQALMHDDKLVLKLGYFHNMFDHQIDYLDAGTLAKITGQPIGSTGIYGAETNTLAYRAQGIEFELEARPWTNWYIRGGYTYLDAKVVQSFSTDAEYGGLATTNPNLPDTPIGSSYPLVGARPFRRPPHTGFAQVNYTRKRFGVTAKAAMASRSDDSTFLSYSDVNSDNTLLLPNRNLDFGYVKLDLGGNYNFKRRASAFVQLDNLLNNQHIGPIGYPGLPLTVRAGMKFQLGGH